jgi:hypothetical protein
MPLPNIRYALDPTGVNPDNLIVGEIHTLSSSQIRAVATTYGPFFTESIQIRDHITNSLLVRGVDFQCVELLQEATVRYGKEISSLILILNSNVSNQVRINYQVLGGLYQNNSSAIVSMYESFMSDDRDVDWVNVLNKPYQYPPTLHNHLLEDIYGFEALSVSLERVRNAIVLSDVPAFEALITWVKNRIPGIVTEAEIEAVTPVNKFVTFERLLYALKKLNFNAITLEPTITTVSNGQTINFTLSTTNYEDTTVLYWTIDHISTENADFNTLTGVINIVGNRGQFNVSIGNNNNTEEEETFRVIIRKNSINGPELAKSSIITIRGQTRSSIVDYMNTCCMYSPKITINPVSYFVIGNKTF